MIPPFRHSSLLLACTLSALVAACDGPTRTDSGAVDLTTAVARPSGLGSAIDQDLATLRRVTAQMDSG